MQGIELEHNDLKREYMKLIDRLREDRSIEELVDFPEMSSYWNQPNIEESPDCSLILSPMDVVQSVSILDEVIENPEDK